MAHLQPKIHYQDLYDTETVKLCRRLELVMTKHASSEEELAVPKLMTAEVALYHLMGELYLEKDQTVRGWMEADRIKEEKLEKAPFFSYKQRLISQIIDIFYITGF